MTDQLQPVRCRAVFSDELPQTMTRSKTYDIEHDLHNPRNHMHAMDRWQKCIPGGWPSLESAKRAATGDHSWKDRPYRIVCVSVEVNVVFTSENQDLADQRA